MRRSDVPVPTVTAMELIISPLIFFDPRRNTRRQPRAFRQPDNAAGREQRLFCARCRHPITHRSEQIAVSDANAHTFTNPNGISFHIACFREAPGCAELGAATTDRKSTRL